MNILKSVNPTLKRMHAMVCELYLTRAVTLKCKIKKIANLFFSFFRAQLVNFENFQGSKILCICELRVSGLESPPCLNLFYL